MREERDGLVHWCLLALCAAGLGLATLRFIAARSTLLMLDLRAWQPERPPGMAASPRPLRLVLQAEPGQTEIAVERVIAVEPAAETVCLRAFVFGPQAQALVNDGYVAQVSIGGIVAGAWPVSAKGPGTAIDVGGIEPQQGQVRLGFALRRTPAAAPDSFPPIVAFEFVTLRACEVVGG